MATARNQRRRVVIDPRFQFRYLVLPIVVVVTTSVCLFVLFLVEAQSLKMMVPETSKNLRDQIATDQMLAVAAVGVVLLGHIALIVWLGLLSSHKIAGPLYRLKKAMTQVAAGDRAVRIRLRRGDQLGDVADVFNAMMDGLTGTGQDREQDAAAGADSDQ